MSKSIQSASCKNVKKPKKKQRQLKKYIKKKLNKNEHNDEALVTK